jgi:hypothetical protein
MPRSGVIALRRRSAVMVVPVASVGMLMCRIRVNMARAIMQAVKIGSYRRVVKSECKRRHQHKAGANPAQHVPQPVHILSILAANAELSRLPPAHGISDNVYL